MTRLIGAGLREGGIKTITKVTGTYPRLILEDGSETQIYRKAGANIIEQLGIAKFAANRKIQALVVECMAIQPQYQWITERKMIHSTIGVLTNVRLDHVDVMGYTLPEIAKSLSNTIPNNRILFTAENYFSDQLKKIAEKRKNEFVQVDLNSIPSAVMDGFKYIEHKENVSLAVAVCEHLGIPMETALKGMYKTLPDEGALKKFHIEVFNKKIDFYNAFAANDPQSTLMIWNKIKNEIGIGDNVIVILNTRQDRLDRARQLTEMLGKNMNADINYLLLIGQSNDVVEDLSISFGVSRNKIINLGWTDIPKVFEKVLSCTEKESTVIAMGNMGGMGGLVAEYFENRSVNYD